MKKQAIMEMVFRTLGVDLSLIERLSNSFEVEISDEQMAHALEYSKDKGNLEAMQWVLVREIYQTVMQRHSDDMPTTKYTLYVSYPKGENPRMEYDGKEIVSEMQLRGMIRERKEREQDAAQLAAPREFHLTDEDKKILLEYGSREEDLEWIELEANVCRYILNKPDGSEDHDISRDEAIRLMGRKKFLYNLDRTAFHWSTTEYELLRGKRSVSFESGLLGRYHNKYVY